MYVHTVRTVRALLLWKLQTSRTPHVTIPYSHINVRIITHVCRYSDCNCFVVLCCTVLQVRYGMHEHVQYLRSAVIIPLLDMISFRLFPTTVHTQSLSFLFLGIDSPSLKVQKSPFKYGCLPVQYRNSVTTRSFFLVSHVMFNSLPLHVCSIVKISRSFYFIM